MESATDETATIRGRISAYLLDLLVVGAPVVGVAERFGQSRRERVRLAGLVGLAVANLYHVALEGTGGQTVGKRVVGIAVVGDDGQRCSYVGAATRTGFRFLDWLPAGYLVGLASIALTERRKRLGDFAANTVVVRTRSDSEDREREKEGGDGIVGQRS